MKMNWKLLLVLAVCLCLVVDSVSAQKRRKGKKFRRLKKIREMELQKLEEAVKEAEKLKEEIEHDIEIDDEVEDDDQVPLADEDETEEEEKEGGGEEEEVAAAVEEETDQMQELSNDIEEEEDVPHQSPLLLDPCGEHHCSAGKECIITSEFKPECRCIESCNVETEPRRKVCSNHNETWDGGCLLHQMRCWCHTGDERCTDKEEYKHLHIEYYGECTDVNECKEEEMAEFPERMREWLFNVMREMAERRDLSEHYLQLERESEDLDSDNEEKWVNAVIWKWCDLDGEPRDKKVSRHELFPIRAPLLILEHCIAPFLDSCDQDDDHYISLSEWGACLKISKDVLEDKCENLNED